MPRDKPMKDVPTSACEKCGKLVIFSKYTLCYECRKDEKALVETAVTYLKAHPGATLLNVAQNTGVDPKIVLKLIRGGRLDVADHRKSGKRR